MTDIKPISQEKQNATIQGLSGNDDSGIIDNTKTGINTEVNQESINFDFFLNIELELAPIEKVKTAVAKAVDVELTQIVDLSVKQSGKLIRIQGKVETDEWEIKTLAGKFSRLVPDRILSGELQTILELDDRPRVSRFYSKSSTNDLPSITDVSAYPLDKHQNLKTTKSGRIEMKPEDPSKFPKDAKQKNVRPENNDSNDDDTKQPQAGKCCIVM